VITEKVALNELRNLANGEESIFWSIKKIGIWATYAQEAIDRNDIQTAKACITVVSRLVGDY
jgi:hypothetical protein